jgi:radical SAM protein with 4Fe4S-binding SPASM domain
VNSPYAERPVIAIWEATRACQLACRHCRASAIRHRHPDELTADEVIQRVLTPLARLGCPLFVITGGDPMERDDLTTVVRHAKRMGLKPALTPSATPRLTFERLAELKDAGLDTCAMSLDGSEASIHDRFRGVHGTFDLTLERIDWLHRLGIPVQINTTVSRFNLDDLPRIAERVVELGAFRWSVFFLVPVGRARPADMLSPHQQEEVMQWLFGLARRVPFSIKTTEAPQLYRMRAEDAAQHGTTPPPPAVWDGNGFLFVSHTGEIYPSGFLPVPLGNVRHDDLAELYRTHPVLRALRDPNQFKGKCGYCEFNRVCGGSRARAFVVTGDYLESDPFCPYIPDPRPHVRTNLAPALIAR